MRLGIRVLDRLKTWAGKFIIMKPLLVILALVFAGLACYWLFADNTDSNGYLVASIAALLWSLIGYFVLAVFPFVPPKPDSTERLFPRLKRRIVRGLYGFAFILFVVMSLATLWLTLRLKHLFM